MEDKKDKISIGKMFLLFVLLIAAPAMSWYYLSGGLKWRKDAIAELGSYGAIKPVWMIDEKLVKSNLVDKKVCAVYFFGENPDLTPSNKKILDIGKGLQDQFQKTNKFRNLVIWENATPAFKASFDEMAKGEDNAWQYTAGLGGWKTILSNQYEYFTLHEKITKPAEQYFAVSDTTGTIRRFYDANDPEQMKRMVQHIAILLPR
jgi:hypothetical protein